MSDDRGLVERLNEEAERLSGHSIDRGSVDAGIASNLASEAAAAIERLLAERDEAREALLTDLNVTDVELQRIYNQSAGHSDGTVKIWGKMLLNILAAVIRARQALQDSKT